MQKGAPLLNVLTDTVLITNLSYPIKIDTPSFLKFITVNTTYFMPLSGPLNIWDAAEIEPETAD